MNPVTGNQELADLLALSGPLREAMLAVPRDVFVPDIAWASPAHGASYKIDRYVRPDEWYRAVFSDAAIITQWEDQHTDPAAVDTRVAQPSSSMSAPGAAFKFLALLAPRDDDRILEIGTGTGYTAAVLSARVGDGNVTSIEVDPTVAEAAAANLKAAGHHPRLIVGDGAAGHPDGGPYDRVHVTCAVQNIPYAWVRQTRPGGVIVAPWQPGHDWGWMVRLTVSGQAAIGRFGERAGYMMLRSQRARLRFRQHHLDDAKVSGTRLDPRAVVQAGAGAELAITALAPGIKLMPRRSDGTAFTLMLYELGVPDGCWAACDYEPGVDEYRVTQYGQRRLWDEVEAAFIWWVAHDSPAADRFGLTVDLEGQRIWLDSPDRPVSPGL